MPEIEKKDDKVKVGGLLALFGVMGLIQLAGGLLSLALMYGVVVIIFRYAFWRERPHLSRDRPVHLRVLAA
jgi:hypothetical protein